MGLPRKLSLQESFAFLPGGVVGGGDLSEAARVAERRGGDDVLDVDALDVDVGVEPGLDLPHEHLDRQDRGEARLGSRADHLPRGEDEERRPGFREPHLAGCENVRVVLPILDDRERVQVDGTRALQVRRRNNIGYFDCSHRRRGPGREEAKAKYRVVIPADESLQPPRADPPPCTPCTPGGGPHLRLLQ